MEVPQGRKATRPLGLDDAARLASAALVPAECLRFCIPSSAPTIKEDLSPHSTQSSPYRLDGLDDSSCRPRKGTPQRAALVRLVRF